jgi:hypothetical protein
MLVGTHAATQGFTPACKLVMDVLPDVCLWLADTHEPANALTYPDSFHVLRRGVDATNHPSCNTTSNSSYRTYRVPGVFGQLSRTRCTDHA